MPVLVEPQDLGPASRTAPVPVGVGGPQLAPVELDLLTAGPQAVLVSGTAGTGRTTAAEAFVRTLRHGGAGVVVVCPSRSPLPGRIETGRDVLVLTGTTVHDEALRAAAASFGDRPSAVVIDDFEQVTIVPREEAYAEVPTLPAELAGPAALGRGALVLCGDAVPVLAGQRRSLLRVVNEVVTTGTRILLCPAAPPVAREHGFTLEADQFFTGPPGRGYLARGRAADLMQFVGTGKP